MPQLVCIAVQLYECMFCVWDCSTKKEVNTIPDCMAFCADTNSSPVYWLVRMAMAPHGNIQSVVHQHCTSTGFRCWTKTLSREYFLPSQWVPVLANHFSYACSHGTKVSHRTYTILAWENSRHLATPPLVSSQNDVFKIPYWWHVTTHIWVVLLIGRAAYEICFNESEALPRSG